jgi:hypothetical protein
VLEIRGLFKDLVMTTRLVDRQWGAEIADGIRRHGDSLRIVCPFIKNDAITRVLSATCPQPLEVITRFNLADFAAGVSDIAALRAVLQAGGRVRGVRGLHAKMLLFGDARAAVTSANLTHAGLRHNHEFGCVSEEQSFVDACRSYFGRLWAMAAPDLTLEQAGRWEAEVAAFLASGGRSGIAATLPDHGVAAGGPVPAPLSPGWLAESGQAFVKFFGTGTDRLAWTVDVLEEVRRSGSHWACTYPHGRRPRLVRDGDTLFMARMVRDPHETLVFGRAIGMAHVDGRDDAGEADVLARPWKAQWPHYVRVHHAEFVDGPLANGVELSELMDALGPHAFSSTQENLRRGIGNVNPRAALHQQPAVRLSPEGASWLNERLEHALALHGRIAPDRLEGLDWPR